MMRGRVLRAFAYLYLRVEVLHDGADELGFVWGEVGVDA